MTHPVTPEMAVIALGLFLALVFVVEVVRHRRRPPRWDGIPKGTKEALALFQDDTRVWGWVPVRPIERGTKAIAPRTVIAAHPKRGNCVCELTKVSASRDHLVYREIDVAPFAVTRA